jgi:hypothetical protein
MLDTAGNHGLSTAIETQRHCIRSYLQDLQRIFPDRWMEFLQRVRAHALLSHQYRHSLKSDPENAVEMDLNFEW